MKTVTKAQWQGLAEKFARKASLDWLSRGWFPLDVGDGRAAQVIINNESSGLEIRRRELETFRWWLRAEDIVELAYAEFSDASLAALFEAAGCEASTSIVMIIDSPEPRHWAVVVKLRELEAATYDAMPVRSRTRFSAVPQGHPLTFSGWESHEQDTFLESITASEEADA